IRFSYVVPQASGAADVRKMTVSSATTFARTCTAAGVCSETTGDTVIYDYQESSRNGYRSLSLQSVTRPDGTISRYTAGNPTAETLTLSTGSDNSPDYSYRSFHDYVQ